MPICDTFGASGGNRRAEADADHVKVKTEMLQMRLMEKRRELVRRDAVDELIDQIAGTVLTHLSGMAARCSRDMLVRRNIDAVVMQIRREIARRAARRRTQPVSRRLMSRTDRPYLCSRDLGGRCRGV